MREAGNRARIAAPKAAETTKGTPMLIAIYVRVSTDEQATEGYSLAEQERLATTRIRGIGHWKAYDPQRRLRRGVSSKSS